MMETGSDYNCQSVMPVHFGLPTKERVDVEVTLMTRDGRKTALVRDVDPAEHAGSHLTIKLDDEGQVVKS